MEILICDRLQSICYKENDIFRKYFKYANKQQAEKEGYYSNLFKSQGILTPNFIKTDYSISKQLFYNEYTYIDMIPLENTNIDEEVIKNIFQILNKISIKENKENLGIEYWFNEYKNDFIKPLNILKQNNIEINSDKLLEKIFSQKLTTFMHGDFSMSNMGIEKGTGQIVIFDFYLAGYGTKNWDLSYLIADSSVNIGEKILKLTPNSKNIIEQIKLITAVKLGRSIRKNIKTEEKFEIFKHWWKK